MVFIYIYWENCINSYNKWYSSVANVILFQNDFDITQLLSHSDSQQYIIILPIGMHQTYTEYTSFISYTLRSYCTCNNFKKITVILNPLNCSRNNAIDKTPQLHLFSAHMLWGTF